MGKRVENRTGKIETFDSVPELGAASVRNPAQGNTVYGVVSDSHNNAYFMNFGKQSIGIIDAKTGKIKMWQTPTPNSRPRRGSVDSQDRLWFGEYRGNKIGMFDPKTEQIKEWPAPSPWDAPYDVAAAKNGEIWSSGITRDRIILLHPASGEGITYLPPGQTTSR